MNPNEISRLKYNLIFVLVCSGLVGCNKVFDSNFDKFMNVFEFLTLFVCRPYLASDIIVYVLDPMDPMNQSHKPP